MAATIPGNEIFSYKSACGLFFNMQNSNYGGAPESERTRFVLINMNDAIIIDALPINLAVKINSLFFLNIIAFLGHLLT